MEKNLMRISTMATIGSLALCTVPTTVQAGSVVSGTSGLRTTARASVVEQAAYRRCWLRDGNRYCRWYPSRTYGRRPVYQPKYLFKMGYRHHHGHTMTACAFGALQVEL